MSADEFYMNVCLYAAGFMGLVAIAIALNLKCDFIKIFSKLSFTKFFKKKK